ncbi:dihydrofolate reductase [Photobacterium gaetbulicola]|uniref:Putative dihydrofolate reductase n=1 Tax=Photobacterium gaetbulicola Gung47 TaxID=658445 RepID=A0A0C5WKG2_9GAMM|nr:dihydrofolate reductase family protein [Photobacterium gaetbulicola]AJR06727.1 putative dihydrofolate reductase [Photobacterium gaetbulicola Gung47]PSU14046.1 dihydrofolate reductase [Photobacterium gaetbulicola]
MANIVYIATSLDGYIADKNGNLDWLHSIPNPEGNDFGFHDFMNRVDALVMGRNTFETVCAFDCEWPYSKPVFVISNSLKTIPEGYQDKAFLVSGELNNILADLNAKGFNELYIDGGITIQNFLAQDLIDEMIITTFPLVLGGGSSLFGELPSPLTFELKSSEILLNAMVKSHYLRQR